MAAAGMVILGLLLTAAAAAQTAQQPDTRTGLIVGQVVDGTTGRAVSGAIVSIGGLPGPAAAARGQMPPAPPRILTGPDGRFVFRDLPRGRFSIAAVKPGYVDGAYGRRRPAGPTQQVTLAEGEATGDVTVRLWRFGAISGTVVDEAGEPVVNVSVRAFRSAVVAGIRRFVDAASAATDDRGTYRLGSLTPADYAVAVMSRHISTPVSFAQDVRGNVALEFSGQVVRVPAPEAASTLQLGDAMYALGRGSPVPPGPVDGRLFVYLTTFYPSAPASTQATVVPVASGEERAGIDFQLRPVPSVRVSGVLAGPDGPASMLLRLEPADVHDITQRDALSAVASPRDGQFTFPAVPSGDYLLRAGTTPRAPSKPGEPDGARWAELPLSVGRDDITGLAVVLQPGLRVSGRLEFEGTAQRPSGQRLEQVSLSIESAAGGAFAPRPPVRADGNGQFASVGMPPGTYFVRVLASPTGWMFKSASYGGRDVADVPLELQAADASGVVITFTDRWSGLGGVVTTPQGVPDAEALVLLFPTDTQSWSGYGLNARRLKSVRTTKAGQYTFPVVPPGDYYAAAVRDEVAADWQDPTFLEALARVATHVTIGEGERKSQNLRTQEIR